MMRALAFSGLAKELSVIKVPIPKIRPDQVLVKMKCCPINPSDLGYIQGIYGLTKASKFPQIAGF